MTLLASCPLCGRRLAVHDGKLREHLPPEVWADRKCPGSGARIEVAQATS